MKQSIDNLICSNFSGGASELVFWAFRYFLGRQTIATTCFARELAKAWPHLEGHEKKLIIKELEEKFNEDDAARKSKSKYLPLGHDCDRAAWEEVRNRYKDQH